MDGGNEERGYSQGRDGKEADANHDLDVQCGKFRMRS